MTCHSFRQFAAAAALLGITSTTALSGDMCEQAREAPLFNPDNHALCEKLWPEVQKPTNGDGTPKPLNEYEALVGQFFNNYCHRDPDLVDANGNGWGKDKYVREVGPFIAYRNEKNEWMNDSIAFHAPVVIWYSPDMINWLDTNRPSEDSAAPSEVPPVPDGVIIAKEMYMPPASFCASTPVENLALSPNGIAYMIRDSKGSQDGWFWGFFGPFTPDPNAPNGGDTNIDWPPQFAGLPSAGFGQYCLNCHASAEDNSTFSSLTNIAGKPGVPLTYLSMDWMLTEQEGDLTEHVPPTYPPTMPIPNSTPLSSVPEGFTSLYPLPPDTKPSSVAAISLPSQTYDNVWAKAGDTPPLSSEYLTSDQCVGCHDAGSTGMAFDMTAPNPHGDNLINLSPYATWRSSPMGLAGRDPIFFAQMSSEETFHPDYHPLIWNTCFGCHGIMGQRQFQLDQSLATPPVGCEESVFEPSFVTAVPYSGQEDLGEGPHYDLEHARYGALARDGISCVACHRSVLTPDQTAEFESQPQNACILTRQTELNENIGELEGFGKTFTGSFLVADPATIYGPFEDPRTKPMEHALGNIPAHDDAIASSEQCGTCHTVHLPVLWPQTEEQKANNQLNVIGDTYEQTTYPEWAFSKFREGTAAFLPEGQMLPEGAGATPISCAGCHMESASEDGTPFASRIASIQQKTTMPQAEYTLPASDIDLPTRTGFARHTLVGLNLFLVKMAQQFPDILGIPLQDPMLVSNGMPGLERTENEMVANAQERTADIAVTSQTLTGDTLSVDVRVINKAGHKFPSGVSFRRAFLEFEVLDVMGKRLWHSGATDKFGVLIDPDGGAPLIGELWYDNQCNKTVKRTDFQPHHTTITKQTEVQIYQEVKLNPGVPGQTSGTPSCAEGVEFEPSANLTTSFLSICHTVKDNRLLPGGLLPFEKRVEIAKAFGLVNDGEAEKMARETGPTEVFDDPAYGDGSGSDTTTYSIPLGDLKDGGVPATVRATLHYQATPPFFLQDRFCSATGVNRDRLYHLSSLLDTSGTPIEDWKFRMVSTGTVPVPPVGGSY